MLVESSQRHSPDLVWHCRVYMVYLGNGCRLSVIYNTGASRAEEGTPREGQASVGSTRRGKYVIGSVRRACWRNLPPTTDHTEQYASTRGGGAVVPVTRIVS